MNEDFLYYLWKHQKFDKKELLTVSGNQLTIIKAGFHNNDSGPDFNEGHIKIDNISWYGQVEMHIKASDWLEHNHQSDPAYNNVILHVVWENDKEIFRQDGSHIPTLELKNRVEKDLINRYKLLQEALDIIPCRIHARRVDQVHILSMLERCTSRRLQKKASAALERLEQNKGDWSETAYQLTLKYLGFKINAQPMEQLARMLPYKILQKNATQPKVVEALLFGQAGLLKKSEGEYSRELKGLYNFYKLKYNLPEPLEPHLWKFMRMRPANFPTLRLAQLGAVICSQPQLFSLYLEEDSYEEFKKILKAAPVDYWQTHYHFSSHSDKRNAAMGNQAVNLLIINVVAPLRAAYAIYTDDYRYMESALKLLQHLPMEKNKIIKAYDGIPLPTKSSFDTQGIITLFEDFCKQKKCLDCDIGVSLLK